MPTKFDQDQMFNAVRDGNAESVALHLSTLHPLRAALVFHGLVDRLWQCSAELPLFDAVRQHLEAEAGKVRPGLLVERRVALSPTTSVEVELSHDGASITTDQGDRCSFARVDKSELRLLGRYFFMLADVHDAGGLATRHRENSSAPLDASNETVTEETE